MVKSCEEPPYSNGILTWKPLMISSSCSTLSTCCFKISSWVVWWKIFPFLNFVEDKCWIVSLTIQPVVVGITKKWTLLVNGPTYLFGRGTYKKLGPHWGEALKNKKFLTCKWVPILKIIGIDFTLGIQGRNKNGYLFIFYILAKMGTFYGYTFINKYPF